MFRCGSAHKRLQAGLFRDAVIGYQFLRVAAPDLVPSVLLGVSTPWAQGSLSMFDALEPSCPDADPDGGAAEPALARRRPPLVPNVGLECCLASTPRRVDLLLGDPGPAALDRLLEGTQLGRRLRLHEPECALDRWVDMVLLEFDVNDDSVAAPALFLSLRPGAVLDGPVLVQLVSSLVGPVPGALAGLLHRCAEATAVGGEAQVTHLGVMASRPDCAVRINVGAVSRGAPRYTASIGCPPSSRPP